MDSSRGHRSSRSSRQRRTSRSSSRSRQSTSSQSRRGTLTRPDTGYSLHSRRVRRDYRNTNPLMLLLRPRVLLLIVILVVVIVVMVLGVSSCIRRGNESARQNIEDATPKNEQDDRVAAGVSASLTSKFTEKLDEGELLAKIAQNADAYDDDRMLELALNEPSSRAFVEAYPSSDKSSRPYDDEVTRGKIPALFQWDDHWGAVTYGDGPLAVTGSGPTTLAMAYMGLTGKTDYTPTQIAQKANKNNYATGESGSKTELFTKLSDTLGLVTNEYQPSAETLYGITDTTVFAIELKEGTLTTSAHWALVVSVDGDGSATVYDPTSSMVSSRPWGIGTLASSSNTFIAISPSEKTLAELGDTSSSTSAAGTTDSGSEDESDSEDDSAYDDYGSDDESY